MNLTQRGVVPCGQLEYLEERRREVGEERIRAAEAERVQVLAARWMKLVGEFTGGDPGIERSLGSMWQQEENIHGIDTARMRGMMSYVSEAMAASRERRGEENRSS